MQQKIDELNLQLSIIKYNFKNFASKRNPTQKEVSEYISSYEKLLSLEKEIKILKNN